MFCILIIHLFIHFFMYSFICFFMYSVCSFIQLCFHSFIFFNHLFIYLPIHPFTFSIFFFFGHCYFCSFRQPFRCFYLFLTNKVDINDVGFLWFLQCPCSLRRTRPLGQLFTNTNIRAENRTTSILVVLFDCIEIIRPFKVILLVNSLY